MLYQPLPMTDTDSFTVRVNRPLLLFLALIGVIFFLAGLDGLWFKTFDWSFPSPVLFIAFIIFFPVCGAIIMLNCFWYLLFPPVMLRFSTEGVTFATGFRYRPHTVPWRHVESIGYGVAVCATMKEQMAAGARVTFARTPEIPSAMATSMGLGYYDYSLTTFWLYADRFPWTIVEEGRRLMERFRS